MSWLDRILSTEEQADHGIQHPSKNDVYILHKASAELIRYNVHSNKWTTPLYKGTQHESLRSIENWLDERVKRSRKRKTKRVRALYRYGSGASPFVECVVTSYAGEARRGYRCLEDDEKHEVWISYDASEHRNYRSISSGKERKRVSVSKVYLLDDAAQRAVDDLKAHNAEVLGILDSAKKIIEKMPKFDIKQLGLDESSIAEINEAGK